MSRLFFFLLPLLISANAWSAKTVFKALTGQHNVDMWTEVQDVPEPSFWWTGNNPNGSDDSCVATGSPVQVDTPFGELKASRMGTGKYYTCGDILSAQDTAKISMISITQKDASAGDDRIAGHRNVGEGWTLYQGSNDWPYMYLSTSGGANQGIGVTQASIGWLFSCGTMNTTTGDLFMHDNGKEDAAASAMSPGTISDGNNLMIGTGRGVVGGLLGQFDGDIALFAGWEGTELTYAQCKALYHNFFDLYESRGKTDLTWSNTGPTGAWDSSGIMWTFTDDFPRVDMAIPPGMTGANLPANCGAHLHPSVTNYVPYSQDLATGWTEVGTVVSAGSSDTPRGSGQGYFVLTDDDAGARESIYVQIAQAGMGGIDLTDVLNLSVFAKGVQSATYSLTAGQNAGGDCTAVKTRVEFVASGQWELFELSHTWADDDCSNAIFGIYPTDYGDGVGATGTMDVAYVYVGKNSVQGSLFCDTTGAAVTCGDDQTLSYDLSASTHIVDTNGDFYGNYRTMIDFTPMGQGGADMFPVGSDGRLWSYYLSGAERILYYITSANSLLLLHNNAATGGTSLTSQSDPTWVPGQKYHTDTFMNFERDSFRSTVENVGVDTGADVVATPDGMTSFRVGWYIWPQGVCLRNARIDR